MNKTYQGGGKNASFEQLEKNSPVDLNTLASFTQLASEKRSRGPA